jgi:hypothetical protein
LLTAKLFGIFFEVLLEKLLENLFFIHLLAIFAPDKPLETIVGKTYLIQGEVGSVLRQPLFFV